MSEERIRLDELERLRGALADAGIAEPAIDLLDARLRELRQQQYATSDEVRETLRAGKDPVAANARRFLWAVAAASLASLLLTLDAWLLSAQRRRAGVRAEAP